MKRLSVFSILFLASVLLFSQGRSTENIGIGEVIIIEIAPNGDVWAGSATDGVAFYQASNGSWSYFDSLTSILRSNAITSIVINPIAGVPHTFIGTLSGAVITQPGQWDSIAQVTGTAVRGIAYRPDSLWVVTGSNFIRLDSSFSNPQTHPNTHPGITSLKSGAGNCPGFWFGTVNSGCYFTSNGINLSDSINTGTGMQLVNNHVNALAIDPSCGRVFVGTPGGFSACPLNGPPCQNYTTANGLPQNDISAVVVGCGNNVWLGTRDSGVVVYNTVNQQLTRVTTGSDQISALACSQNCITYVGDKQGNITQVDSNKTVIGVMTGIKDLKQELFSIMVFPQPSGNQVNFVFEKEITKGDLYVTDINGRTQQHLYVRNNSRITADVSALPNGIYFYQLYNNKQLVKTGKLSVLR